MAGAEQCLTKPVRYATIAALMEETSDDSETDRHETHSGRHHSGGG
jgi:hypothetical protein